jgi:hypothetical protein
VVVTGLSLLFSSLYLLLPFLIDIGVKTSFGIVMFEIGLVKFGVSIVVNFFI